MDKDVRIRILGHVTAARIQPPQNHLCAQKSTLFLPNPFFLAYTPITLTRIHKGGNLGCLPLFGWSCSWIATCTTHCKGIYGSQTGWFEKIDCNHVLKFSLFLEHDYIASFPQILEDKGVFDQIMLQFGLQAPSGFVYAFSMHLLRIRMYVKAESSRKLFYRTRKHKNK